MTDKQFPGIEILEVSRESSTTITWKALQRSLDRTVFVRMLKPEATEAQRNTFENVARVASRIKHPGIIPVIDVGKTDEGNPYIMLEHVEGTTLKEELARIGGQFTPAKAVQIGTTIAEALDTAWKQASLVHRNLKPEDIVITDTGAVKIVEFSAAIIIQSGADPFEHDEGLIVGTPNYMSPEQAQGLKSLDFHADMYSLGALLYHMLTGVVPFDLVEDPAQIMELQISTMLPSMRHRNSSVSANLESVIARCMMKDPAARYDWWQDVVADLQRAVKGRPISKPDAAHAQSAGSIEAYTPQRPTVRPAAPGLGVRERVAANERRAAAGAGSGGGTRFLLWLLLGCALAYLWHYRWNNPDAPLSFGGGAPAPAAATSNQTSQQRIRHVSTSPSRSASPHAQGAPSAQPPSSQTQTAPPSGSAATAGMRPSSPEKPAQPSATNTEAYIQAQGSTLVPALIDTVTEALRREDIDAARTLLRSAAGRSGNEPARAAALKALDTPLKSADIVGRRFLAMRRGQPTAIAYRGRELNVVPDRYMNGIASGDLLLKDGSKRPFSINLADMDIAERLRLMGPQPDANAPDADADTVLALMALASEDRALMGRMATRVPALAPFLEQAARQ